MENIKIDFDHYRGSQIGDEMISNLELEKSLSIIKAFNPDFSKDGNQYCYLYGTLPNDCIVGFGDTPYLAMNDFVNNFFNQKVVEKDKGLGKDFFKLLNTLTP